MSYDGSKGRHSFPCACSCGEDGRGGDREREREERGGGGGGGSQLKKKLPPLPTQPPPNLSTPPPLPLPAPPLCVAFAPFRVVSIIVFFSSCVLLLPSFLHAPSWRLPQQAFCSLQLARPHPLEDGVCERVAKAKTKGGCGGKTTVARVTDGARAEGKRNGKDLTSTSS